MHGTRLARVALPVPFPVSALLCSRCSSIACSRSLALAGYAPYALVRSPLGPAEDRRSRRPARPRRRIRTSREASGSTRVSVGEVGVARSLLAELSRRAPDLRLGALRVRPPPAARRSRGAVAGERRPCFAFPLDLDGPVERALSAVRPGPRPSDGDGDLAPLSGARRTRAASPSRSSTAGSPSVRSAALPPGPDGWFARRPVARLALRDADGGRRGAHRAASAPPGDRVRVTGQRQVRPAAPLPRSPTPPGSASLAAGRPVLVGGARPAEGEEAIVLDAWEAIPERRAAAARDRSPPPGALRRRRGARSRRAGTPSSGARRSQDRNGRASRRASVYLLDSIGELASLYGEASLAFVGGSLVAGGGGHNPIEAWAAGRRRRRSAPTRRTSARSTADGERLGILERVADAAALRGRFVARSFADPAALARTRRARAAGGRREPRRGRADRGPRPPAAPSGAPDLRPTAVTPVNAARALWSRAPRGPRPAVSRAADRPSSGSRRPVVSVGNITVGGTGKTPFVDAPRALDARPRDAGPRSSRAATADDSRRTVLVSDGRGGGPLVGPLEGGDEPVAARAGGARRRSSRSPRAAIDAARAAAAFSPDVFLLDDGFQHLAARARPRPRAPRRRDPFGGERYPPFGRLREPLSALGRADAIVFTSPGRARPRRDGARAGRRARTRTRPVFTARIRPAGLCRRARTARRSRRRADRRRRLRDRAARVVSPNRSPRSGIRPDGDPRLSRPPPLRLARRGAHRRSRRAATAPRASSRRRRTPSSSPAGSGRFRSERPARASKSPSPAFFPFVSRSAFSAGIPPRDEGPARYERRIGSRTTGPPAGPAPALRTAAAALARSADRRGARSSSPAVARSSTCSPAGSRPRLGARLARLYLAVARSRAAHPREATSPRRFPELSPARGRRARAQRASRTSAPPSSSFSSRPGTAARRSSAGSRWSARSISQAARARGKGVFLLSAHFGSWELGAVRAGMLGEPIASVVRPLDNPLLEEELARRRTRFGNRLIRKKDAAREILRRHPAGRDGRDPRSIRTCSPTKAIFVPFFGRLAATTPVARAPAAEDGRGRRAGLHLAARGRPLPARVREADPRRGVRRPRGEPRGAVRAATARYMAVTERAIRRDPAAWLWMHNRWRTRPEEFQLSVSASVRTGLDLKSTEN